MKIKFKKLDERAIVPSKRDCDAGYDIYGIPSIDEETIGFFSFVPGSLTMVPTGLATELPNGYAAIVKERGSTGSKGLAVRCGVIDAGYRGEWFICINNTGDKVVNYPVDKALAQVVIVPVMDCEWEEEDLSESERGEGKLGSSRK